MDRFRHVLAVVFVVSYPTALLFWFLVHPWARWWRKLGPARTYLILMPVLVVFGTVLFRIRSMLVGPDLGTAWKLIVSALLLYGVSFWFSSNTAGT